jgi:anti-sigma factor RsiW
LALVRKRLVAVVHLREEQLIAYMDGEADEAVKQHIEACNSCTARLEPFVALQSDLLRALYRLHCPDSQVLGDYHMGLLAEAKASTIREHLVECPYCAAELEALKQFLASANSPPAAKPNGGNCIHQKHVR